jgi:hypothetical protein
MFAAVCIAKNCQAAVEPPFDKIPQTSTADGSCPAIVLVTKYVPATNVPNVKILVVTVDAQDVDVDVV